MSILTNIKISKLANSLGLDVEHDASIDKDSTYCMNNFPLDQYDTQLFIGDNLVHLQELALHSSQVVDVCYIDPPYNTGSKFIYQDNRKSNNHPLFGSHASWMSFMLPRLCWAKELLKKSGVITISIDDYELAYLKLLMDRIFGEDNFIACVIVCRSKNGKGSKKNVATNHEYLLVYGNTSDSSLIGELDDSAYPKSDEYGSFRTDGLFRKKGDASLRTDRPNMYYPLYFDGNSGKVSVDPIDGWEVVYPTDSKGMERRWLWGLETARKRQWQLFASKKGVIYVKNYASQGGDEPKRRKIRTIWSDTSFYTERATNEITEMFGSKIFDTPKPIDFIKKIIDVCGEKDAVVLDFFAGSGTTAQAVHSLNRGDSGNRKCLLMENDTPIPNNHAARELGYKKISDIVTARLNKIQKIDQSYSYTCISLNDAHFEEKIEATS